MLPWIYASISLVHLVAESVLWLQDGRTLNFPGSHDTAALQKEGFQAVFARLQRQARQELVNAQHDLGRYGQLSLYSIPHVLFRCLQV